MRWVVACGAAVVVVLALVLWLRSSGGEAEQDTLSSECAGAGCDFDTEPTLVSASPPKIVGQSAAILEGGCGALIYGSNEQLRLPPASLAKLATALVAIDLVELDTVVNVRVNSALLAASTASTVMGLEPGQQMSMRDLLHGLLLPSGNDAAIAIAEAAGGSEAAFVELMNQLVTELGLRNTHFTNPHGLDDPGLYSSALDMALMGRVVLAEPALAEIVRTENYQPAWDGARLWNGNALLGLYPEAIGIKIGYTEDAQQTIVAAAERDGRLLILSVFGSWDRYADAIALFDWAFARIEQQC